MKNYCQNCGHDCHCGKDCIKEYDKGTKILTNPEDLFNGA